VGGAPTLIAIDGIVLDDDAATIDRVVDLLLPPHLAQVLGGILGAGGERTGDGDAQDMAGEELLGGYGGGQGRARLGVAEVEEDIGRRDEEDVLLRGRALDHEGALGEGAEEWV